MEHVSPDALEPDDRAGRLLRVAGVVICVAVTIGVVTLALSEPPGRGPPPGPMQWISPIVAILTVYVVVAYSLWWRGQTRPLPRSPLEPSRLP